jgi:hypothetical protein
MQLAWVVLSGFKTKKRTGVIYEALECKMVAIIEFNLTVCGVR